MFRRILAGLFNTKSQITKRTSNCAGKFSFELLEERQLLAITWTNQFDSLSNRFENVYGTSNAVIASQLVSRAINDWNAVITNSDLTLDVFAGAPGAIGGRGVTENIILGTNGRPISADITLDDNGAGRGWFFDSTPFDDAEFTAIANSRANGTGPAFHG